MKIIMINGSHRKTGATALILNEIYQQLQTYDDVTVDMIHVADLELNYCVGCGRCYQTGSRIFKDDIESLSLKIAHADGIILASPTYASNVSGQIKVIIDRGHFVMEQLLYGKYAISVTTYENYGGRDSSKILNRLLSYSGARLSGTLISQNDFDMNPLNKMQLRKKVQKTVHRFYQDILRKQKYLLQDIKHFLVFLLGIRPFVLRKGLQYDGVVDHWKEKGII